MSIYCQSYSTNDLLLVDVIIFLFTVKVTSQSARAYVVDNMVTFSGLAKIEVT
jgi:hypothetical protein